MEKTKIYSPAQIGSAAFLANLGGPLAGVFLLKKNFDALDNKPSSKRIVIWGTLYILLNLLMDVFYINAAGVLFLLNIFLALWLTRKYQLSKKDILKSEQYGFQSNWRILGIGIAFAVAATILLGALFVLFDGLGIPTAYSTSAPAVLSTSSLPDDIDAIKQKAQAGDAEAQYALGMAYYMGEMGLTENQEEGVKWLRKSADQGYLEAQHNIGVAYHEGAGGLSQSDTEAVNWWRKAADQGFVESQYNLGIAYRDGLGMTKNIPEAEQWFQKAADQGHADAKEQLEALRKN